MLLVANLSETPSCDGAAFRQARYDNLSCRKQSTRDLRKADEKRHAGMVLRTQIKPASAGGTSHWFVRVSVYFAAAPLILSEMNWVCPGSQTQ